MVKKLFSMIIILLLLLMFFHSPAIQAAQTVRHDLTVTLDPESGFIEALDTLTVQDGFPEIFTFYLHKGMKPSVTTAGGKLTQVPAPFDSRFTEKFRITLPQGSKSFTLHYSGKIHHPLEGYGKEYARGFRNTPGTISRQGVYLSGATYWYPHINANRLTFSLRVNLPPHWNAVSQGSRVDYKKTPSQTMVMWVDPTPQEEIFLLAALFHEYGKKAGEIEAMVFLREEDEKLSSKYIDATRQYIRMYENLIGPYPYSKFALVENFWETGFGMPSFTLLGPKVIRFPFILHSSYPHEILHNWWGNSVYPDYSSGNWSEGLTAYLSDHLIKEQRGKGAAYRQAVLQKYLDYVGSEKEFPLTAFTSRHGSLSEAVGYGKAMMFFHMLRRDLSDEVFKKGLQHFYKDHKFRNASYNDIKTCFEKVSGRDLKDFFSQWVENPGAPQLAVSNGEVKKGDNEYVLNFELSQTQEGPPYNLNVPVAITMEGRDKATMRMVNLSKRRQIFSFPLKHKPIRLDIDPRFDLFRRLDHEEIPPALSLAFGAKKAFIVLPSKAGTKTLDAYRALAEIWGKSGPESIEIVFDSDIENLPEDLAPVLFGWENRFRGDMEKALKNYDVQISKNGATIEKTTIPRSNHSIVLSGRRPGNQEAAITWVAIDDASAAGGLGRKLPHYHKYSFLGFKGKEPTNISKGRWPVLKSPLTVYLQEKPVPMAEPVKPPPPLAEPAPPFSKNKMLETIRFLADESLEGRGFGSHGLDKAALYIAGEFKKVGLEPAGDEADSFFQEWEERGGPQGEKVKMKNVLAYLPGTNPQMKNQSIVIGAHYDHLGRGWPDARRHEKGKIHYGADDNASGVSVLIELARVLRNTIKPERNIVFAAFTGEEAGRRGSLHFVKENERFPLEECMAMLNLDTVGRLYDKKLLVIGGNSAREWVHIFRGAGYVTGVNVAIVNEELDSSDQVSFLERGVPAVQLFSGPHLDYHRPGDRIDKIDAKGLVKVASLSKEVIEYLALRKEFLNGNLQHAQAAPSFANKKTRKVLLGAVPDFSFQGTGCRLSGVAPGSPIEKAGLQDGDVLTGLNRQTITGLQDLSRMLKALKPGVIAELTYLRGGEKHSVQVLLTER